MFKCAAHKYIYILILINLPWHFRSKSNFADLN